MLWVSTEGFQLHLYLFGSFPWESGCSSQNIVWSSGKLLVVQDFCLIVQIFIWNKGTQRRAGGSWKMVLHSDETKARNSAEWKRLTRHASARGEAWRLKAHAVWEFLCSRSCKAFKKKGKSECKSQFLPRAEATRASLNSDSFPQGFWAAAAGNWYIEASCNSTHLVLGELPDLGSRLG